ncbi:MAG TPA: radical SAM protein [Bacteroidota bacterium]|nr:radical SAM protein [Bacteroidota bacterium]
MAQASMLKVARAVLSTPGIVRARPSVNLFLCGYLRRFKPVEVGGKIFIHSHLPPLNSPAYRRFVNEHLLGGNPGPSHAQIGVTSTCPQNCSYCYNRGRTGEPLDTATILQTVRQLQEMGVFWIGLTGGEPLLNVDLPRIIRAIGERSSSKLFTTGATLTPETVQALGDAGLDSVSVSLDHWKEEEHDRRRGADGAYRAALQAIDLLLGDGRIHVGVSAVLSPAMLAPGVVMQYLEFLSSLGIHEAWLSETKPTPGAAADWVVPDVDRDLLIRIQDTWNAKGGMTVNYLGHFEGAQHFGCSAGNKMVYIDPFGEVSPCVFIPMTFGNVRGRPVREIFADMREHFPTEDRCFINRNAGVLARHASGNGPIPRRESVSILDSLAHGAKPKFFRLLEG